MVCTWFNVHLCSNEAEVGSAVRKSGIPREEVYITTKVGGGGRGGGGAQHV